MGKGLALQFKKAFPANCKAYEAAAKAGAVEIGTMFVFEAGGIVPEGGDEQEMPGQRPSRALRILQLLLELDDEGGEPEGFAFGGIAGLNRMRSFGSRWGQSRGANQPAGGAAAPAPQGGFQYEYNPNNEGAATGFNPADMYAVDHIRRVLETYPGVFTGIGEFTIHKEFVSAKVAGPFLAVVLAAALLWPDGAAVNRGVVRLYVFFLDRGMPSSVTLSTSTSRAPAARMAISATSSAGR